jgi:putative Holliday junction resolvase
MSVIALDVGERRIGVAVSDPSETFALPLRTIERTRLRDDLAAILEVVSDHEARTIVVGDPLTLRGERGIAAQKIDEFVASLQRAFGGTIERVDERMTTALVTRQLIGDDVSRARRKRVVDRLAAAAILETYLGMRRGRGRVDATDATSS